MIPRPPPRHRRGFTLLELLVVVALVGGLAAFLLGNLGRGRSATALRSGEAIFANLVAAARTRAMSSGQPTRVLVHFDSRQTAPPARFLRYVVMQAFDGTRWETATSAYLPEGVYVVPGNFPILPAGLFEEGAASWIKSDGAPLRSTAFQSGNIIVEAVDSAVSEQWAFFSLAAAGTTAQSGHIVLASGSIRAPGLFATGDSPVALTHPEAVRGLKLSQYGVTTLIDDRASF